MLTQVRQLLKLLIWVEGKFFMVSVCASGCVCVCVSVYIFFSVFLKPEVPRDRFVQEVSYKKNVYVAGVVCTIPLIVELFGSEKRYKANLDGILISFIVCAPRS